MITAEMEVETGVTVVDDADDSEHEYPPELLKKWLESGRIMDEQIERGELKPQSVRDVAAKYGVILN